MSKQFITEFAKHSFAANVEADLSSKAGYPVELVDADTQKIQVLASGICIGVLFERLEGSSAYLVHTRGPIRKAIAASAINAPAYVKMTATGLAAASSTEKTNGGGIAISPKTIAAGDMVSFIQVDCVMP